MREGVDAVAAPERYLEQVAERPIGPLRLCHDGWDGNDILRLIGLAGYAADPLRHCAGSGLTSRYPPFVIFTVCGRQRYWPQRYNPLPSNYSIEANEDYLVC